jgi:hypothetical protein
MSAQHIMAIKPMEKIWKKQIWNHGFSMIKPWYPIIYNMDKIWIKPWYPVFRQTQMLDWWRRNTTDFGADNNTYFESVWVGGSTNQTWDITQRCGVMSTPDS